MGSKVLSKSSIVIEYFNYVVNKRKDVKRLSKAKGSRWLQYENIKIPGCKELISKTLYA